MYIYYIVINVVQVIDLLNPGAKRSNLTVRWNKRSRAFVVDNLFSIECTELDDLVAVLEVGLSFSKIFLENFHQIFCRRG